MILHAPPDPPDAARSAGQNRRDHSALPVNHDAEPKARASVGPERRDPAALLVNDFIDFPSKDEIVALLRTMDESPRLLPLYENIGDRLAARTYESSASAFILIEMLYEYEESAGDDMSYLLPRSVLTLTGDRDLALSALGAFNEIKDAIVLQAPAVEPPAAPPRAQRLGQSREELLGAVGVDQPDHRCDGAMVAAGWRSPGPVANALTGDKCLLG